MKPTRKSKSDIERIVGRAAKDAIAYIQDDIAPERDRAAKYLAGDVTLEAEEGRSKVVATKCRDAVRSVKPSLVRVFLQSEKAVEFIPKGPEDVGLADAQTEYASYLFNKSGGFRLLNDWLDDALSKKAGFGKVYIAEESDVVTREFELTGDQMAALDRDEITVLEYEFDEMTGLHRGTVQEVVTKQEIKVESLPPEEFLIDADARSIEDFYICGHHREMRVSDFVEMGFDFDEIVDLTSDEEVGEEEKHTRRGFSDSDGETDDLSMRKVLYTEAYMRIDAEGTGVAQLYACILAGSKYKLLDFTPVDDVPFAVFEVDPEGHTFFGRSLVELIMNDQDASTALLRGILDNVALTNAARVAVADGEVNPDDMMNGEIGGIVRTKGSPHDKIMPMSVPFAAAEILSASQYYDQTIDNKTGVSRASAGLDPDALSNATATAVDATTRAALAQPELMARHLAEGGLTRVFRLMLRLMKETGQTEEMVRLNGQFAPIPVDRFDPELDVTINVGLGTENTAVKLAALGQTMNDQGQLWAQYGPQNGLVDMTMMRNVRADILALSGVHNAGRYYKPMTPEIEAQIAAQAAAEAQSPQPDPIVEAEMVRAQAKLTSDQGQAEMKDDLERDKLLQDGILKAAEILAKHGATVDLNALYQMQAQN